MGTEPACHAGNSGDFLDPMAALALIDAAAVFKAGLYNRDQQHRRIALEAGTRGQRNNRGFLAGHEFKHLYNSP